MEGGRRVCMYRLSADSYHNVDLTVKHRIHRDGWISQRAAYMSGAPMKKKQSILPIRAGREMQRREAQAGNLKDA